MTADEQRRVAQELVATIEHGIRSKRWLYWPPGPMLGQVFDRARCEEDVRLALTKFPMLPPAADASDPHVGSTGNPSQRD
jgi:hypothetical protein